MSSHIPTLSMSWCWICEEESKKIFSFVSILHSHDFGSVIALIFEEFFQHYQQKRVPALSERRCRIFLILLLAALLLLLDAFYNIWKYYDDDDWGRMKRLWEIGETVETRDNKRKNNNEMIKIPQKPNWKRDRRGTRNI